MLHPARAELRTVAFVVIWLCCSSVVNHSTAATLAAPSSSSSSSGTATSTTAAMLRGAGYIRHSTEDGTPTKADPLVESWRQHQRPPGQPNLLRTPLYTTIVIPETKLLVTVVPKAGSTATAHLLAAYRAHLPGVSPELSEFLLTEPSPPHGGTHVGTHRSVDIHERSNPRAVGWKQEHARLAAALIDPDWRTAAIVRDPVARFVSAFVSKCVPGHDPHPDVCIFLPQPLLESWLADKTARRVVQPEEWPTFEQAVQHVAAHLRGEAHLIPNIHWVPQTHLNGGLTNATALRYYDAVVVYESATFSRRLEQLLEFAGATLAEKEKVIGHMHAQRARMPAHRTGGRSTMCKMLATQEQVDILASYYAEDYLEFAHLGLSPPILAELCGPSGNQSKPVQPILRAHARHTPPALQ